MLPLNKISKLKLLEVTARLPFFKRFSTAERTYILESGTQCYVCKQNKPVQIEGDLDTQFYLLLSGKVAIIKKTSNKVLGTINPGEFIGEGSFINNRPKSASGIATDESILLSINQAALNKLPAVLKDKVKDAIIEGMANRIVYLTERIQGSHH